MTDEQRFAPEKLEKIVFDILKHINVPDDEASLLTRALVSADARGMNSHGVMRLPVYANRIISGGTQPGTKGKILRETASTVLLDGEDGIGHVVTMRAMEEAIRKAKEAGAGVVGVTRSNHFGEGAFYIRRAIESNMIAMLGTNGSPNMPVWGGITNMTGPHCFAAGIPTDTEFPIILDMSWGVVSKGKILYAAEKGEKIPLGWGVDSSGKPTDDPQKVIEGGWTLPIGGYKGWGLILIFEILSGVLTGGRIAGEIGNLYGDPSTSQSLGHFVLAIDIEAFGATKDFKRRMDAYIRMIKQSELAPGFDEILLPGEREFRLEQERRMNGIPVSSKVVEELKQLAEKVGAELALQSK